MSRPIALLCRRRCTSTSGHSWLCGPKAIAPSGYDSSPLETTQGHLRRTLRCVVNRNHVRCRSCESEFAIRISVGGGLQRFVFPCPVCSTQLTGEFFAEQPTGPGAWETPLKPFELRSDDFERLEYDDARDATDMLAVAVDTEIPVHLSMFAMPVGEIKGTPFIRFVQEAPQDDAFLQALQSVNELREIRFGLLPSLRRAAVFYAGGGMDRLSNELQNVPGYNGSQLAYAAPWEAVSVLFRICLAVIGAEPVREPASEEFNALLRRARARNADSVRILFAEYAELGSATARRALVDTFLAVFADGDALVPGLLLEATPELDIDNFRIQRSDFDALKSRYQDIFELTSRSLVLPVSLANIVYRGDLRSYPDGRRRSLPQALKATAATREDWLAGLPHTEKLYSQASRQTRNLIGHRLLSYDYERAALIDDAGNAHNYLRFLADYLNMVRTLGYVVDLVEVCTRITQRRRVV